MQSIDDLTENLNNLVLRLKKPEPKKSKLLIKLENNSYNRGVKSGRRQVIPFAIFAVCVGAGLGYSLGSFKATRKYKHATVDTKLSEEDLAKIKEAVQESEVEE